MNGINLHIISLPLWDDRKGWWGCNHSIQLPAFPTSMWDNGQAGTSAARVRWGVLGVFEGWGKFLTPTAPRIGNPKK